MLTMNASCPTNNKNPYTNLFDQVVIFEPHTDDGFAYVPIGAPVLGDGVVNPVSNWIGTNGFPQERKNLLNLAHACQCLGYGLYAFIPESPHANAGLVASQIRQINPIAECVTRWVTDDEMLDAFTKCTATCYPYLEWFQGSSSAVMAGVSARRPIIVSRASQFDFLFQKTDEVYFIESARPTADEITAGLQAAIDDGFRKVPHGVYEEHRWDRVGQRYIEVYKELARR